MYVTASHPMTGSCVVKNVSLCVPHGIGVAGWHAHDATGEAAATAILVAGPLWRSRRRDRGRLHIAGLLLRPPHKHIGLRRARIGRTQGNCSVVWL